MKYGVPLLIGGTILSGCGDKNSEYEKIEYTIKDTLDRPILNPKYEVFNSHSILTYNISKGKNKKTSKVDFVYLDIKGNIDNKYKAIYFIDDDNDGSILGRFDCVLFYKTGDSIGTSIRGNSVVRGIWEYPNVEVYQDSSELSKLIIKEGRKQIVEYFNPLYKRLRSRAEERYEKGIGIIEPVKSIKPIELKITEQANKKIKKFF